MAKFGRDMDLTLDENHAQFKKMKNLKPGQTDGTKVRCDQPNCRNGFLHNNLTGKSDVCPRCRGYGFYRKGA